MPEESKEESKAPNQEEEKKDDEKKGWDGEPLLTDEELKRQEQLFKWLIDDTDEWEANMSEEEKKAQEDFED